MSSSISMIVEKPRAGSDAGLGRELLVKRGRGRRASIAHRTGIAIAALWLVLTFVLGMTWGADAMGSVIILGLVLLPAAGFAFRWGAQSNYAEVAVYELGIARRERGVLDTLSWNQISEVFETASEHTDLFGKETRGSFTFVAHDGRKLVVDSGLPGWREIGRLASAMAQEPMQVAYELGLVSRRPLRFGNLVIDAFGIHTPEGSFPWNAISFVRLDRKGHDAAWCVHVGAWAVASRIPSGNIANARALIAILDRLGKLDVPASAVLAELENVVEAA